MKITLIGHCCVDVFHLADGSEKRELGGIFHAVAAMANIASDRDTLFPVFGIGVSEFELVTSALSEYKNIDLSGVFQYRGESNFVHYFNDGAPERSLTIAQPIPFSRIKNYLDVDGVYINMISGLDITLNTLDEIRLEVRGKKTSIHLDMHCLALTVNADGTRTRQTLSEWRRWCFMVEGVQMNEEEAAGISFEHFNDDTLAKQMMHLMVKAFCVTRGEKGVTLFQSDHKHLIRKEFANDVNPNPVSIIGSGDIFGASFFYAFLKKKKYDEAAMFAQRASALTTHYSVAEKHRCLAELRKEL
ncbi:MAG: carbohydrate kinase family protein [Bacteroidota bacterium]|nr:carbohydrate kinase family protein [Bacteroidota bacterium]